MERIGVELMLTIGWPADNDAGEAEESEVASSFSLVIDLVKKD